MRFGIDLGGTKIEILALDGTKEVLRERVPTPLDDYEHTITAIAGLIAGAEKKTGRRGTVGIAIPGTISTKTGLVKNANSTRLIGHPLDKDVARAIGRPVRVANDANCFTLSEASDGAGTGKDVVFGVIAGTGCGGGISVGRRVLNGAHGITGEWGHNPLPAPTAEEMKLAPDCYCGRASCIEAWISGTGLANDFRRRTGRGLNGHQIDLAAQSGDTQAKVVMEDFYDRFARSLASIVNVLDPDVIVLGGGLSNIDSLYRELPARVERYAFFPEAPPVILKNLHGDSSGVRGAAWLWTEDEAANVK